MSLSGPNPLPVFDALTAYQRTAALRAAIELEVFTAVGEGRTTAAAIAQRAGTPERGMRMLCDYMVVCGFLTKQGGAYGLTSDTAVFLDKRSHGYIGGIAAFLTSETLTRGFRDLTEAVREGGTMLSDHGTMDHDHPVWIDFANGMAKMMQPAAVSIAEILKREDRPVRRVLDIAAGHGLFGITLAQHFPEAEVTAVDWAAVLSIAQQNAIHAGVGDRYHLKPGSAFDLDLGEDYDVVLVTNFYHHFSLPVCGDLAKKLHAAIAPGGRKVTLEFVPDENRVSPPGAGLFALVMLATTAEGDAYTYSELDGMLRGAGFHRNEAHPFPGMPHTVIVSYR
ncbi:MAG: class I SAM-dependent methyltransferase [Bryobacterales bacterium]|nr:class I SAM-dependent methyltransferase [Bryobacterales bacterium]